MSNLKELIPYLDEIMSKFYKSMLSHEQLSVFFKDKNQIDRLIESQKKNFIDSLKDSPSQFENRYLRLGALHYDLCVPNTDFLKSTKIWRRNFIDHAINIVKKPELVQDVDDYFNKVDTLMSKGYLNKQLEVDKKDMDSLIKQYQNNEAINSDATLTHLQWLYQILVAIKSGDASLAPELDVDKCTIHDFLKEPPAEILSLFSEEHFNDLHHRLHIDARSLFYFIEKNDYLEVLSLYSNLLSVYKITLITIGNINLQSTVINLKQNLAETKDELIIARDEAIRANKAKSDFLSSMSHELRTPLNAILGYSQLIEVDARDDETQNNTQEIIKAGKHLLLLINQILDLSKIESGTIVLSIESHCLNYILNNVLSLIKPIADKHEIQLINNVGSCADIDINVDEIKFTQVLLNILSNAIKYNSEKGNVIIDCSTNDEKVLNLSMTDSGSGLTSEQLLNIFQPFYRAGAENSNIQGTGLGLSISKSLIEQMGGKITVTSDIGKGSCFLVQVPLS